MEVATAKICPLLSISEPSSCCVEEECALWLAPARQCALMMPGYKAMVEIQQARKRQQGSYRPTRFDFSFFTSTLHWDSVVSFREKQLSLFFWMVFTRQAQPSGGLAPGCGSVLLNRQAKPHGGHPLMNVNFGSLFVAEVPDEKAGQNLLMKIEDGVPRSDYQGFVTSGPKNFEVDILTLDHHDTFVKRTVEQDRDSEFLSDPEAPVLSVPDHQSLNEWSLAREELYEDSILFRYPHRRR